MAWIRVGSTVPQFRRSISVDATAAATASDVQITIPSVLSEFWDVIDASGNELRVTDADGQTVLNYKVTGSISGFDRTTRDGIIQIDNYDPAAVCVGQVWLYYGITGASSGATSFTYAASRTGYLYPGAPISIISAAPQRPGDTRPRDAISKAADEITWVWFDFHDLLQQLTTPDGQQEQWEELDEITYFVTLAGATQAGMVSASSVRVIGGRYVQVLVQGGATGSSYTLVVQATTTYPTQQTGRTLAARCLVRVKDVSEV
jgi:hypothetical protein